MQCNGIANAVALPCPVHQRRTRVTPSLHFRVKYRHAYVALHRPCPRRYCSFDDSSWQSAPDVWRVPQSGCARARPLSCRTRARVVHTPPCTTKTMATTTSRGTIAIAACATTCCEHGRSGAFLCAVASGHVFLFWGVGGLFKVRLLCAGRDIKINARIVQV